MPAVSAPLYISLKPLKQQPLTYCSSRKLLQTITTADVSVINGRTRTTTSNRATLKRATDAMKIHKQPRAIQARRTDVARAHGVHCLQANFPNVQGLKWLPVSQLSPNMCVQYLGDRHHPAHCD